MKGFHKVPCREVYCDTWRAWLAEVVLCFVVYKLMPPILPDISSGTGSEPKA
jgi:hypothetical protein